MDQDFSGRVKNIEDKLKGMAYDKKPKDLNRAIGKTILPFSVKMVMMNRVFLVCDGHCKTQ